MNTNNEFIALMDQYGLSYSDVSAYVLAPRNTVYSWTVKPESTRWRAMPNHRLLLLKLQIKDKKLQPVKK